MPDEPMNSPTPWRRFRQGWRRFGQTFAGQMLRCLFISSRLGIALTRLSIAGLYLGSLKEALNNSSLNDQRAQNEKHGFHFAHKINSFSDRFRRHILVLQEYLNKPDTSKGICKQITNAYLAHEKPATVSKLSAT